MDLSRKILIQQNLKILSMIKGCYMAYSSEQLKENKRVYLFPSKEQLAERLLDQPDTYLDADGVVRCKKCHKHLMFYYSPDCRWLECFCQCSAKASDLNELREKSGLTGRLAKATFSRFNQDDSNIKAFTSCKKYFESFDQIRSRGMGMYLFGSSGVGKTYLAACVGNSLLDRGVQVILSSVSAILSDIKYTYTKKEVESSVLDRYVNADFVIFDDVGSEKYKANDTMSFAQEKFFQIIDGRYNNQLPTFFTSNYNLEQLVKDRGIMVKTVDRISEMSTRKFEIKGVSRRVVNLNNLF